MCWLGRRANKKRGFGTQLKWTTVGRKMTCKQVNAVREPSLLFFAQRDPAANRQFNRIDRCSFDCFSLSPGHCRTFKLTANWLCCAAGTCVARAELVAAI